MDKQYGDGSEKLITEQITEFISFIPKQKYYCRNTIAKVIRTPKAETKQQEDLIKALISIIEVHPTKITGIKTGKIYKEHLSVPKISTVPFHPKFEFNELHGLKIYRSLETWMDVYQQSVINGFDSSQWFDFDILFIEPDSTHKAVTNAWMLNYAHPLIITGPNGIRDVSLAELKIGKSSLKLNGSACSNSDVLQFAKEVLDNLNNVSKMS